MTSEKKAKRPLLTRNIYVIEIMPKWHALVAPDLPEGKRCFYVGETSKDVKTRFREHRTNRSKVDPAKRPAARVFKRMIEANGGKPLKRGEDLKLRRTISTRYSPVTGRKSARNLQARAIQREEDAVLDLRSEGHAVYPRNVGGDQRPFVSYKGQTSSPNYRAREERRDLVSSVANEVRKRTGIATDAPFTCMLSAIEESLGLAVIIAPLGPDIAGLYAPLNGGVALIAGKDTGVRRRFTLAHELGHHCLGHGDRLDTPDSLRDETTAEEVDANQFAAEFIAPQEAIESFVESLADASPSLELVCRVSNHFAVSAQMARIRLETCGILSDRKVNGQIDEQIFAGKTKAVYEDLELKDRDDICATPTEDLPRLPQSAEDTALGDLINGEMSAEEFAELSGMDVALVERVFVRKT